MNVTATTSSQIEWSFENVTDRVGAAPGISRSDMTAQFGESETSRLVDVIGALCDQTVAIEREINWHQRDLNWAQGFTTKRLQEDNPGLSPRAAQWIARWFTYQVK